MARAELSMYMDRAPDEVFAFVTPSQVTDRPDESGDRTGNESGDHEPLECLHGGRRFHARTTLSGGLIRPLLPDVVVLAGEEGFEPSIS